MIDRCNLHKLRILNQYLKHSFFSFSETPNRVLDDPVNEEIYFLIETSSNENI